MGKILQKTLTSNCIFLTAIGHVVIEISLIFVHKDPFDNKWTLAYIMAWHRKNNKPLHLSESCEICSKLLIWTVSQMIVFPKFKLKTNYVMWPISMFLVCSSTKSCTYPENIAVVLYTKCVVIHQINPRGPFNKYGLSLIPAKVSNYIKHKVCD